MEISLANDLPAIALIVASVCLTACIAAILGLRSEP